MSSSSSTPQPLSLVTRLVLLRSYHKGYDLGDEYEFGFYRGKNLAKKRRVILVEINYRLGALGFLANEQLAASNKYNTTGNYGVQDQQAALKFVYKYAIWTFAPCVVEFYLKGNRACVSMYACVTVCVYACVLCVSLFLCVCVCVSVCVSNRGLYEAAAVLTDLHVCLCACERKRPTATSSTLVVTPSRS